MALQNIVARNRKDAFYGYKMPKLITKIEAHGNSIKTKVVNMVDVANTLARRPDYITEYFGCKIGGQSEFDKKTGTTIVAGAHGTVRLAALLMSFMEKYVQCNGCGDPETHIVITKSKLITLDCAACGYLSDVNKLGDDESMTKFILNHYPKPKKGSRKKDNLALRSAKRKLVKEGVARYERAKMCMKLQKAVETTESGDEVVKKKQGYDDEELSPASTSQGDVEGTAEADEGNEQWQTDTSAEAAQTRTMELTAATSEIFMIEKAVDKSDSRAKQELGRDDTPPQPRPKGLRFKYVSRHTDL